MPEPVPPEMDVEAAGARDLERGGHLGAHRAAIRHHVERDRLGREFTNRDRSAAQGERRHDHVDAAAVLEARVGERRGLVDAAADRVADALRDLEQMLLVAELNIGELELALAFDEGLFGAVDHDVRNGRIGEQFFQGPEAEQFVDEDLLERELLAAIERKLQLGEHFADDRAEFLGELVLGERRRGFGIDALEQARQHLFLDAVDRGFEALDARIAGIARCRLTIGEALHRIAIGDAAGRGIALGHRIGRAGAGEGDAADRRELLTAGRQRIGRTRRRSWALHRTRDTEGGSSAGCPATHSVASSESAHRLTCSPRNREGLATKTLELPNHGVTRAGNCTQAALVRACVSLFDEVAMLLILAPLLLDAQTPDFGWLVGNWCTEPRNGATTCETWKPMDKGRMQGAGTTRAGTFVKTNEAMTIIVDESGTVFHAEPVGQKPADFPMRKFDPAARSVVFEDAAHDYPQRVRYWREGEALMAEISLLDGSKAMRKALAPAILATFMPRIT